MGIKNANFNRIISLTLNGNNEGSRPIIIKCPVHGRKPKIEINGTWTTDVDLPAFNLSVQNLYIDITRGEYSSIEVEVGYEGNTKTIQGDIITMYQETPGPEGKTIIQCVLGRLNQWLDSKVSWDFAAGATLKSVLESVKDKIGADRVLMGEAVASTLKLKEPLKFTGTARETLSNLVNRFQDNNLSIFMQGQDIRAVCLAQKEKADIISEEPRILQYMSAPPQENSGGDDGSYYTTVNAPWMPELSIGDLLTIPSRVYIRNFSKVGGNSKTQNIQVTTLSFHFGTVGSVNSMTVQGFLVTEGK